MKLVIAETIERAASVAAEVIAGAILASDRFRLGVATGSSPMMTYRCLGRDHSSGLAHRDIELFALDEYIGLGRADPRTYEQTLRRTIGIELGLPAQSIHVPEAWAVDLEMACSRYEDELSAAGGIDLQILGIGANGHIGFNEPYTDFRSRTHVANLMEETRSANSRFFENLDEVPTRCVTQGIGTILDAKRILLLVNGRSKAEALSGLISGPITWSCPASALQLHADVTIIADRDAVGLLSKSAIRG